MDLTDAVDAIHDSLLLVGDMGITRYRIDYYKYCAVNSNYRNCYSNTDYGYYIEESILSYW
jgi:hypothetical protein